MCLFRCQFFGTGDTRDGGLTDHTLACQVLIFLKRGTVAVQMGEAIGHGVIEGLGGAYHGGGGVAGFHVGDDELLGDAVALQIGEHALHSFLPKSTAKR